MLLERRRLLAAIGLSPVYAFGQGSYPSRPVRIVIPFASGGPTDVVARLIAERMSARLMQPFIVEARPGAGGSIASELVARSSPDGYTLMIGTATTHAVNPSLQGKRISFDPLRSFAPIAQIARVPIVLVVKPDLPARTLPEFIALLRSRNGQMNYGSSGTGSMGHLASVLLLRQIGVDATHVPYKGSAPMTADLVGGRIDFASDALASVLPFVRDGRVRALAIATPDRARGLPDLPTFEQAGLPGYQAYTWNVVFAPADTPATIIGTLNQAFNAVLAEPELARRLEDMGQPPVTGTTPQGTATFVASELAKWEPVVRASGATAD